MDKYFIGIDVGTSESKGVLCSAKGEILCTAAQAHDTITPRPGFAEHDPVNTWWKDVCTLSRQLLADSGIDPAQIAGVGCSAISCAATAVGADGLPLRNAILYGIDTRAEEEIALLNEQIGRETILQHCGEALSNDSYGPKVYWIKRHEPEIFEKTAFFTFAQGYINYRLCGVNAIDSYSVFFATPFYNYQTQDWDPYTTSFITDVEKLPKIAHAAEVIGTVTAQAALETGLKEGTPVICGTTDAGAEAFSVGVRAPGDTMVMYGSTIYINSLTDTLHVENNPLWKGRYLLPGACCVMAGMSTTGLLTRWLRDNMAAEVREAELQGGENAYQVLFKQAAEVPAGSEGVYVLPYFAGERMPLKDPLAKGMIFGLNLTHTRAHMIRAALEGIGYGLDQNLAIMRSLGLDTGNIIAVGGGTKSREWMQIMSDITGSRQRVPAITVGASFGDAMLAAIATGTVTAEETLAWNGTAYTTEPNEANREVYTKGKETFKGLYEATKEYMHLN